MLCCDVANRSTLGQGASFGQGATCALCLAVQARYFAILHMRRALLLYLELLNFSDLSMCCQVENNPSR